MNECMSTQHGRLRARPRETQDSRYRVRPLLRQEAGDTRCHETQPMKPLTDLMVDALLLLLNTPSRRLHRLSAGHLWAPDPKPWEQGQHTVQDDPHAKVETLRGLYRRGLLEYVGNGVVQLSEDGKVMAEAIRRVQEGMGGEDEQVCDIHRLKDGPRMYCRTHETTWNERLSSGCDEARQSKG